MPTCPICHSPLDVPADGSEAVCRICVMNELMGDPDTYAGSSDADDYEIIREIGRGGDGTVYLAQDLKVDRQVAIKLLNTLRLGDKSTQRRFYAESDAIASLDHPNIIPIFATGEMDSRPFFTMKYIDHGNLSDRFDDFSSASDIADLISKIARGIHHAHRRGLLHRDLKPSNILIDQQKEPYITDFGLAKRESENLNLTLTGAIMGTPAYMSPEQARGDTSQITTATDIFSIGTMFYQLLSGRTPFGGENPHAVLKNVIESEVTFHGHETQHFDRDLETICLKCLRKEPENRYPTALALAEDLERWSCGEPVTARRISSGERVLRFVKKHPVSIAAVTFGILSLITGLITSTILWQRADDLAHSESAARHTAEDQNYYSTLANAYHAREDLDLGLAQKLLHSLPEDRRAFEWHLLAHLSSGDQEWTTDLASPPVFAEYDTPRKRIILLTADRKVHSVNPADGTLTYLTTVPIPPKSKYAIRPISHLRYSPDGAHYLFVENSRAYFLSSESNEVIHEAHAFENGDAVWLDNHQAISADLAHYGWQRDGETSATSWKTNLNDRSTVALPHRGLGGPIDISPDRQWIAFSVPGGGVAVYPRESDFTSEPILYLGLRPPIRDLAFSQDSCFLHTVSGPADSTFHVFSVPEGKQILAKDWPSLALVIPTSEPPNFFLAGNEPWFTSWDTARWLDSPDSAKSLSPVPILPPEGLSKRSFKAGTPHFYYGHQSRVVAAINQPGEPFLITASADQTLRRWSLNANPNPFAEYSPLLQTSHEYFHPTASHDGNYILYTSDGISRLWNRSTNQPLDLPAGHNYLAILNDGRLFTRISRTGVVVAWQYSPTATENLTELWRADPGPLYPGFSQTIHTSVSPDEKRIAILHPGQSLTIDTETKQVLTHPDQSMRHGSTPGQSIAVSPDSTQIAITGYADPRARVYPVTDFETHRFVEPATPYRSRDSACAFSRDGKKLYFGNCDGWVRVFDAASLKELLAESWRAHSTEITALAVSQKGDIVVTAGGSETIFWSAEKKEGKERRRRLRIETGLPARNWIQFCGNDTLLLHSAPRSDLEVWEAGR